MTTTPIGAGPGNSGLTLTDSFSSVSRPNLTLAVEVERVVAEEDGRTVRLSGVDAVDEAAKSALPA
jgi:hypothetical protein